MEAPPRILIIEDDVATAQVYQRLLEAHGYDVKVAPDGEFAQAALVFRKPDLVVLDLMLPKVPGVEVLHFLRSRDEGKQIPTIVFSNALQSPLGEAARMEGGGATQYLSKADCSPERFLGAVHQALVRSRLLRSEQPKPAAPARSAEPVTAPTQPTSASSRPVTSTQPASSPPGIPFPSPPAPMSAPLRPAAAMPIAAPLKPDASPASTGQPAPGAAAQPNRLDRNAIEAIQSELRQTFLQGAPPKIAALSGRLLEVTKAKSPPDWSAFLGDFQVALGAAMANAGFAGLGHIARFSTALEGLIKDLREEAEGVNPSALRTVVNALDFLIFILQEATQNLEQPPSEPFVLVVDDEPICRGSASIALRAAGMKTISLEDPLLALRVLAENPLDLVVTDVDMPGTDGYELCKQLRLMRKHKTTPVIFLTGLSDFQSRARSALSGGNEYIVKPFVPAELVVKALTLIMKPPAKGK